MFPRQIRQPAQLGETSRNLLAGFALMAVAIPEQIATARLAGAPPAMGLLVFIAGSLGFFFLGSNRYLSAGADSTIAPIFASGLAGLTMATGSHYLVLMSLLAVLVGVTVGAAGLLRLGWIARLLSLPVITGFLAGISIHIAISQLPALLGIAGGRGMPFQELATIIGSAGRIQPVTMMIGIGVFSIVLICEHRDRRLPGALIAVVLAAGVVSAFDLTKIRVMTLGDVPMPMLWPPRLDFNPADVTPVLPIALLVSLLVIIQTVTVSRSFKEDADNINRDLVGLGFGNILSGLLGGFPVNSSPPRTAIAYESGATSRLTGLLAAIGVSLFLAFGLRLLASVPQAALAGLLLFVAWRIFRVEMMKLIWSQSRAEFALLAVTAAAIVFTPIETGIAIGIGLSVLHGVWTVTQTRAMLFEQVPGTTVWWPRSAPDPDKSLPGIVVVGFQAPLFFLNSETFRRTISEMIQAAPQPVRAVILEASSIVEVDFSGAQVLLSMIEQWKLQGVSFYIARLESVRAQRALESFGILKQMGEQKVFHSVSDAVSQIIQAPNVDGK